MQTEWDGRFMDGAEALAAQDESAALFEAIRLELLDEYCQDHDWPWIVGYSGGKDSTFGAERLDGDAVAIVTR